MSQSGFDSIFENLTRLATLKSCNTTKLSVDENLCSPTPVGVEISSEGSDGSYSRKARLFEWIELSVAV